MTETIQIQRAENGYIVNTITNIDGVRKQETFVVPTEAKLYKLVKTLFPKS